MLNNKRKYFLYTLFFLSFKFQKNECIFEIKTYSPVIYSILLFRMIDNLISNLRKQSWINLEFYFKIYEFSNF